ncbi:MAG: hypothetical protein MUD05_12330, partial [Candidatus Nanopelagicales bacterium]|nr:hypothetical protein [Candidatus Nanopelagicales bacterium]
MKVSGSAISASNAARSSGSRSSSANRTSSAGSAPVLRMSRAAATAFSLITSWAVSLPTPARTDAMRILVVARNGRYLSSSLATTASKTPNS